MPKPDKHPSPTLGENVRNSAQKAASIFDWESNKLFFTPYVDAKSYARSWLHPFCLLAQCLADLIKMMRSIVLVGHTLIAGNSNDLKHAGLCLGLSAFAVLVGIVNTVLSIVSLVTRGFAMLCQSAGLVHCEMNDESDDFCHQLMVDLV